MKKEVIIKHLKKYWWAYLLGVVLLAILTKAAVKAYKEKKGGTRPDIDNSIALGLSQGLWPELNFQQPICVGESNEYTDALLTIFRTNPIQIAHPTIDLNIWAGQTTYDNALQNYIDYAVNGDGMGSSKLAGVTYSGCINLSDALKLGSAIIN